MASRVVDVMANSVPPSLSPHFSYEGELDITAIQARLPLLPKMTPFVSGHVVRYMENMRAGQAAQLLPAQKASQVVVEALQDLPQPQTMSSAPSPLLAIAKRSQSPVTTVSLAPSSDRNIEFIKNTSKGDIRVRDGVRFNAFMWKKYFGDVGVEPPLPRNVHEIDNALCPFSNDPLIKVKDTHMWVLIPAQVNGMPLTLNTLCQLIQNPKGDGFKTDYESYSDFVKKEHGDNPPRASYWALMTRDVIPGSRNKSYADQKEFVAGYTGYTLPPALAAAVCLSVEHVISETRLYPRRPWTYTRCIETVNGVDPVAVGAFRLDGFDVQSYSLTHVNCGAAGFREFNSVLSPLSQLPKSSGSITAPAPQHPLAEGESPVAYEGRNTEFIKNTSRGVIRGEVRFGAAEWKKYFGDVDVEPPLPPNVNEIDNAPCPFSNDPSVRVKDTHMWVLIPATVKQKFLGLIDINTPLTLNTLQKLIQNPLGSGHKTNYFYDNVVKNKWGGRAVEKSYWALMTRDVISGEGKSFAAQRAILARHTGYTLPPALVVAVCLSVEYVTSGTQLYPKEDVAYTCCKEILDRAETKHVHVGGFGLDGFDILHWDFEDASCRVAAFRMF